MQRNSNGCRLVSELAVGEARDFIPGNPQGDVARAITLERRPRSVEFEPVQFDHETAIGPIGVDLEACDLDVCERAR